MAVSLQDVSKKKSIARPNLVQEEKENITRPWQSFNPFEMKVRTLKAQEAVRKAREIVEKNEALVARLSGEFKVEDVEDVTEVVVEEDVYMPESNERKGIWGLIRFLVQ